MDTVTDAEAPGRFNKREELTVYSRNYAADAVVSANPGTGKLMDVFVHLKKSCSATAMNLWYGHVPDPDSHHSFPTIHQLVY